MEITVEVHDRASPSLKAAADELQRRLPARNAMNAATLREELRASFKRRQEEGPPKTRHTMLWEAEQFGSPGLAPILNEVLHHTGILQSIINTNDTIYTPHNSPPEYVVRFGGNALPFYSFFHEEERHVAHAFGGGPPAKIPKRDFIARSVKAAGDKISSGVAEDIQAVVNVGNNAGGRGSEHVASSQSFGNPLAGFGFRYWVYAFVPQTPLLAYYGMLSDVKAAVSGEFQGDKVANFFRAYATGITLGRYGITKGIARRRLRRAIYGGGR